MRNTRVIATIAAITLGAFIAQPASAGLLQIWTGPSGGDWATQSNWSNNASVAPPNTLGEDASIGSADVNITGTGAFSIGTLSQSNGSTLTIRDSGILGLNGIFLGTSPNSSQMLGNVVVRDLGRFVNSGTNDLTFSSGTISVQGNGTFNNDAFQSGGRLNMLTNGHLSVTQNGLAANSGVMQSEGSITLTDTSTFTNHTGADFSQLGGAVNILSTNGFTNLGTHTQAFGTMTVGNSSVYSNQSLYTKNGDSGTTTITDNASFTNDDVVRLNGGATEIRNGGKFVNFFDLRQDGGTLTIFNTGELTNGPFSLGFNINGGLVQVDAGGVINGGGQTTLTNGTLRVNGQVIQAGVTVNGGTLEGDGTIQSNVVNNGGVVSPGNSPGTLTIDGNYTQGSGGTLAIEIASLISFDVLDILGTADLDGTLDLTVDAGYALTAQNGDSFKIMNWNDFTGGFSIINGLDFGTGTFQVTYAADGLFLTVSDVNVPAPGAMAIFAMAVLTLIRRRAANTLPV